MNCYEWRSKITGSVSISVDYNETGDGYAISGGGTITNKELYTGWTRKELQCLGSPENWPDDWILRGSNLCEGRTQIEGVLSQSNTITVTYTPDEGDPVSEEWGIFFQIPSENYAVASSLLPVQPYPDWENDPYSVALRNQIDALTFDYLRVGFGTPPATPGYPAMNSAPVKWLKDGVTGTSENGFLKVSLAVKFMLV